MDPQSAKKGGKLEIGGDIPPFPLYDTLTLDVRGWCKSTVHTIASPYMVQTLFTGLTYPYHMEVSRHTPIPSHLHINITEYTFSKEETTYALEYITPWVSSYLLPTCTMSCINYIYTCAA